VLVAFVVYRSQLDGDTPISQRYHQKMINRSDRKAAAGHLKRLCLGGWLEISRGYSKATATRYRCGPRISNDDKNRWAVVGERLFGPEGSLGGFLTRPVIKHGHLGLSGMLVVGTLLVEGPVGEKDLVKALSPLVARTTLTGSSGVFDRLVRKEVLDCPVDGVWCVPDDLEERIGRYEVESGVGERVAVLHAQIESEQKHHNEEVLGSPYLQAFRKFLKRQPCSKCGRLSGRSGGEVDHFPPIHSGGFDAVGRQYPICRSCNNKMSAFTKRMPTTGEYAAPVARAIYTDDPDDLSRFAQDLSEFMYLNHQQAFEDDDPEMSARGIAIADPLWLAAHGFVEGAEIVDTTTGEISEVLPADDDKWHLPPRAK